MSTHIVGVTLKVVNSEWQRLQLVEIAVDTLPEDHPLIVALRKVWTLQEDERLAAAQKDPGDLFANG